MGYRNYGRPASYRRAGGFDPCEPGDAVLIRTVTGATVTGTVSATAREGLTLAHSELTWGEGYTDRETLIPWKAQRERRNLTRTGTTTFKARYGRCEDAPCCGCCS